MSNQVVCSNNSSSSSPWKNDVFLSFRGEDTRNNFTSHLYNALKQRVTIYKDDKDLERGKPISSELLQAIEKSQISIIVLSRNYASSTWCLDELAKIVQCRNTKGQIIFPIFYHVDPSMVRKQTGAFQEAFVKHEENFRENKEKVHNWRNALREVGNLSGWDAKDRDEFELIEDIIEKITSKLRPTTSMIFKDLVGIDSRVKELRRLIGTGDDIRIIGICGMGGIGKTTIARVVYEWISYQFEGSSFLANVRETSEKYGLVSLQQQLVFDVLRRRDSNIYNVYDGMCKIITMLRYKKVLVVVDDVACVDQLNALVGRRNWFGPGSRIIMTTRDEHLLKIEIGVDEVYKANGLNYDEALELFSLKAFKKYEPPIDYMQLSNRIVEYTGGLPLALEVLGCFFFGRTIDEWKDAVKRLHRDFTKEILDILQISFDGLQESEKKIFLDIACFFKGKNKDHVVKILDGCGFSPTIGINLLIEKSLINVSMQNGLWMHDLLQEMGKQIVKRESPMDPGRCSRLWEEDDIHHVLTNNMGTEAVEGIMLDSPKKKVHCCANAFSKMINLRLLKIRSVELLEGRLDYLSNKLVLLDWNGYPLESLPPKLRLDKVVELNLDGSLIKQLSKEIKPFDLLTSISFKDCQYLRKTPDFVYAPNLEEVIFKGCKSLRDIHPSLLLHGNIEVLDLRACRSLTTLANKIHMKKLVKLRLSSCSRLKKFPEIVGSMDGLELIDLSDTAIKEVPSSIQLLTGLRLLFLVDCKNLVTLPRNNSFKSLTQLALGSCSKLQNIFDVIKQETCSSESLLYNLCKYFNSYYNRDETLFRESKLPLLSYCSLMKRSIGSMAFRFIRLQTLDLCHCNLGDESIARDFFSNFPFLLELLLSENKFTYLPGSIDQLPMLKTLVLEGCKRLQSLPELPSNLHCVNINGCVSLQTLSNALRLCNSGLLEFSCANCFNLIGGNSIAFSILREHLNKEPKVPNHAISLCRSRIDGGIDFVQVPNLVGSVFSLFIPGGEIPEWFRTRERYPSSIRIERPPYLCSSKLLGLVVCCVVGLGECPSRDYSTHVALFHRLSCNLNINGHQISEIRVKAELGQTFFDHLWLLYIPRATLDKWIGPNDFELFFIGELIESRRHYEPASGRLAPTRCLVKACGSQLIHEADVEELSKIDESTFWNVKEYGVHPIYEEDVEDLNKIDNESTFWNVKEFDHQDLVGSTQGFEPTQILSKGVQGLFY